ncbi:DUF5753 domain-containing protein [Prauserella shujinwangii]|uniref:DUF5753 domain-containing protein n=1 Tax=Prauserella shujinwangii TaxID=1453103 RepID=UPI000D051965|nr:DUF5753 domain-containing protein [Prauserella shujinwangii]
MVRRWVGSEFAAMRNSSHNPSRSEAAKRVEKSPAALGHVESGRNFPAVNKIEVLLSYYGHGDRAGYFAALVERAKARRQWWDTLPEGAVPEWYQLFLGYETSAVETFTYAPQVVPDLLQTPAYAEAIVHATEPEADEERVELACEVRAGRTREVLDRDDPCVLRCVIDEAALRRPVGGPAVLREQLRHLLDVGRRSNVDIRVLPTDLGAHASTDAGFTVMAMPPELEGHPGVAYVATVVEGTFFEKAGQIGVFRDRADRLRGQALSTKRSREFIDHLASERRRR